MLHSLPNISELKQAYTKFHIQERFGITFHPYASVCPPVAARRARCLAKIVNDESGVPRSFNGTTEEPEGYSPQQFRTAYNVSGVAIGQPIIGIIDAFG